MERVKLHHASKEYKEAKLNGLIDSEGYLLSEPAKEDKYEALNAENTIKQETKQQEKEPSIPLSVVDKMISDAIAKNNASSTTSTAQQVVYKQNNTEIFDIQDNIPEFENWEIKPREFRLVDNQRPITRSIQRAHNNQTALQYFDKRNGKTYTMRYSSNQPSFFIENQSKDPKDILDAEIIFQYGTLKLGVENTNLQKFLFIHSGNGVIFEEYDPSKLARIAVAESKIKAKALSKIEYAGKTTNRAIVSLEVISYIEAWTDEQVEEEIYNFVEKNPKKYLEYCDDPTIKIKGVAKSALAKGDIIYKGYKFYDSDMSLILEVDRNKNEFDEIANYFQTSEGRTLYEYLLNKN